MKTMDNTRLHNLMQPDRGQAWYELACLLADHLTAATTAGAVRVDEAITQIESGYVGED